MSRRQSSASYSASSVSSASASSDNNESDSSYYSESENENTRLSNTASTVQRLVNTKARSKTVKSDSEDSESELERKSRQRQRQRQRQQQKLVYKRGQKKVSSESETSGSGTASIESDSKLEPIYDEFMPATPSPSAAQQSSSESPLAQAAAAAGGELTKESLAAANTDHLINVLLERLNEKRQREKEEAQQPQINGQKKVQPKKRTQENGNEIETNKKSKKNVTAGGTGNDSGLTVRELTALKNKQAKTLDGLHKQLETVTKRIVEAKALLEK